MEYNFTSKDNYSVFASSILSTQDRKIMAVLYLPLIGVDALALYFVLWSDLEGDSVMSKILRPFQRLTSQLDLNISKINKASNKLEALGLVQRYVNDNKEFIFVLKSPKSASAFFKNDVLRTMLKDRIGEEEFDRSKLYFAYKPKIGQGFVNVSKSFQDVYEYPDDATPKDNDELVERNEGKVALNYNFDQLYSGLVSVSKYAFTDKVKEAIGNIMYCYDISIVDMRSMIMKAYNFKDLTIDIDKIRNLAEHSFKGSNKKTIKAKEEKVEAKYTGLENIDEFIDICESKTPIEFLEIRDGIRPSGPDLSLLIDMQQYGLPNGVLNVILDYTLKRNDNILSRPYVLKICSSFQRSKIRTAYDTMLKLNYRDLSGSKSLKKDVKVEPNNEKVSELDENIDDLLKQIDRGEF